MVSLFYFISSSLGDLTPGRSKCPTTPLFSMLCLFFEFPVSFLHHPVHEFLSRPSYTYIRHNIRHDEELNIDWKLIAIKDDADHELLILDRQYCHLIRVIAALFVYVSNSYPVSIPYFIGVDFGGSPDAPSPIFEKRPCIYMFYYNLPQKFGFVPSIFLTSLLQCPAYDYFKTDNPLLGSTVILDDSVQF